jgi:hypothetical protein
LDEDVRRTPRAAGKPTTRPVRIFSNRIIKNDSDAEIMEHIQAVNTKNISNMLNFLYYSYIDFVKLKFEKYINKLDKINI